MTTRGVTACPCGRTGSQGKRLAIMECCGRYIGAIVKEGSGRDTCHGVAAPDAESLMRSRYTAFVLGDEPYLLASWHASTRPPGVSFVPGAKWLGLQVRGHRVLDEQHAEVEFVARYRTQAGAVRLHEHSRFVHENGRWYYVDGDVL